MSQLWRRLRVSHGLKKNDLLLMMLKELKKFLMDEKQVMVVR